MKYLIIFLLIVSLILTILIVRQNREIKDLQNQVNKCKADILQWSKLSQYAEEFHAVPDSTAPFDTLLSRKDGTLFYSKRVEGGVWFIQKSSCGDSMGCFLPDPPYVFEGNSCYPYNNYGPDDRMWPDDRDKKTRATVISDTNNFGSMWCIDECGNETRYKRVNGKWILQKD